MLTKENAKPLLALTAFVIPWDVFLFSGNLGWGMTFAFGRYVDTAQGNEFLTTPGLYALIEHFDPTSRIGIYLWMLAAVLALAATLYIVGTWRVEDPPLEDGERFVGLVFIFAGALFVLSRAFIYEYLLYSPPAYPRWFSVPVGGLYVLFVGVVFYRDLF